MTSPDLGGAQGLGAGVWSSARGSYPSAERFPWSGPRRRNSSVWAVGQRSPSLCCALSPQAPSGGWACRHQPAALAASGLEAGSWPASGRGCALSECNARTRNAVLIQPSTKKRRFCPPLFEGGTDTRWAHSPWGQDRWVGAPVRLSVNGCDPSYQRETPA